MCLLDIMANTRLFYDNIIQFFMVQKYCKMYICTTK